MKPKTASPALPTWRSDHCQGKGKRKKIVIRRRKRDVYLEVRARVLAIRQLDPAKVTCKEVRLTKEALAVELGVTEDCVVRALQKLNQEGLVYQRSNSIPHERWSMRGSESSWQASTYKVRWPETPVG